MTGNLRVHLVRARVNGRWLACHAMESGPELPRHLSALLQASMPEALLHAFSGGDAQGELVLFVALMPHGERLVLPLGRTAPGLDEEVESAVTEVIERHFRAIGTPDGVLTLR